MLYELPKVLNIHDVRLHIWCVDYSEVCTMYSVSALPSMWQGKLLKCVVIPSTSSIIQGSSFCVDVWNDWVTHRTLVIDWTSSAQICCQCTQHAAGLYIICLYKLRAPSVGSNVKRRYIWDKSIVNHLQVET